MTGVVGPTQTWRQLAASSVSVRLAGALLGEDQQAADDEMSATNFRGQHAANPRKLQ